MVNGAPPNDHEMPVLLRLRPTPGAILIRRRNRRPIRGTRLKAKINATIDVAARPSFCESEGRTDSRGGLAAGNPSTLATANDAPVEGQDRRAAWGGVIRSRGHAERIGPLRGVA